MFSSEKMEFWLLKHYSIVVSLGNVLYCELCKKVNK
jgi:hypothetical protein